MLILMLKRKPRQMDADNDITFGNTGIEIQSGATIQMNAGNDIKLDNTSVDIQDEATLQIDAGMTLRLIRPM